MNTFWDNIPVERRGKAYCDLNQLYYNLCGKKLEEPENLRDNLRRQQDIINAPDYEELEDMEIEQEMSRKPEHMEKVK